MEYEDARAEVHKVVVGPMDNNVYVVRCKVTGRAVLVDAANEADRLLALAGRLGVGRVVQTHGHLDHIGAVPAMRAAGHEVGVHPGDADRLPGHDFLLGDGDAIEAGRLTLRALHTPGHTPGSTCFGLEGTPVLFSGDALFPGGPGTVHRGGDWPTTVETLGLLFDRFDDDTAVLPGHGAGTLIGRERPHVAEWVARGW